MTLENNRSDVRDIVDRHNGVQRICCERKGHRPNHRNVTSGCNPVDLHFVITHIECDCWRTVFIVEAGRLCSGDQDVDCRRIGRCMQHLDLELVRGRDWRCYRRSRIVTAAGSNAGGNEWQEKVFQFLHGLGSSSG
jgi:hypothetical protein